MTGAQRDPFYSSPFGPFYRRHAPCAVQPEYRIHELNKRLQSRPEDCDNLWWEAFTTEFFQDDATLTLSFCLEDGPKTYTIGRTLIPRYFSTVFEGGVLELYFELKYSKESFHNSTVTIDCPQCTMITQHGKPVFTKVCTEGHLILVFPLDDLMRIKTWHLTIRHYSELIPRSILAVHAQDPGCLEQLSKNISRGGLTNLTLNYLRLCVILEPMQELMSRHKTYGLSPRDCLKNCLFHKWQRMVTPPAHPPNVKTENFTTNQKKAEPVRQTTTKRRRRKNSASGAVSANTGNSKKRSSGNNFNLPGQLEGNVESTVPPAAQTCRRGDEGWWVAGGGAWDVMVVGEPSLMSGELGDEDECLITRLENTHYESTNGFHDSGDYANSPVLGNNSPWNEVPLSNQDSKTDAVATQALK